MADYFTNGTSALKPAARPSYQSLANGLGVKPNVNNIPKNWGVVGKNGVEYVAGETSGHAAKRLVKKAAEKAAPILKGAAKAANVGSLMMMSGSQNADASVRTNSKGKNVSFFGDTFSGQANMRAAQSLVNSGAAKNIEEAKNIVAEMGGMGGFNDRSSWDKIDAMNKKATELKEHGSPAAQASRQADALDAFDREDFDGMDATPATKMDGMDATPPKTDTIPNSLESQANAKPGDVVNGKTLTQGDINWAKEQMAKKNASVNTNASPAAELAKAGAEMAKEGLKDKEPKMERDNYFTPENMDKKEEGKNNSNGTNSNSDSKGRKTSIMPIVSKIVGGLLGGKWGAFGDEHSQLGQSIADAGRMAGYTQGELDMKDIDMQYQKEFADQMSTLSTKAQRDITKLMADLYHSDPNTKEYMDKQFELQKQLQENGFKQGLISQIMGSVMTGLTMAFFKSDSNAKVKYCLDK